MAKAAKNNPNPADEMPDFGSDSFESLLNESMNNQDSFEGQVVTGTIVAVDKENVVVDVGLKSEGRISLREFQSPNDDTSLTVGDKVDVYVDQLENRNGEAVLSREKARREEAWGELEKLYEAQERVNGVIYNRVKGGFTVDLQGAIAFLPGSQVDIRPIKDASPLMGVPQPFMILKMDRARGNIVVSRRAILEESRAEARQEILSDIQEGSVLDGVVKNITDYGAFIDLGGVDGLLHVTDISWSRINHPSEVLTMGQTIKVQVIKYSEDNQRISLGMKQLEEDPWADLPNKYAQGSKVTGKITNVTDYGAFVELEEGIEGLVHVSEMSWTKKNIHPSKIVNQDDEVEVVVLEVDTEKRRISLGIKQTMDNPWMDFSSKHPIGEELEGIVTNTTEFGIFVRIDEHLEGMVHISDISWEGNGEEAIQNYNVDDKIQVKILEIDAEKERISLGIKQLSEDPFKGATSGQGGVKKNQVVTCTITEIDGSKGIIVAVGEDALKGYIKKTDLAREKSEQRTDRFAVDEKVDAKIINVDNKTRELSLSIKAREIDEDKAALKQYGSSDSGASLGDILGAAIQAKEAGDEPEADAKEEKKPAAKKKATKAKKEEASEEK
ncbi:MAG: 30S ribosomal protein S1 [Rickettsiales bacterium]|nr:30S ribosomal protein S1 [Rickettsiales bacterium]